MPWMTPKTDWTANENYNALDINRVEINTQHLRDYLASIDYPVPQITTVTNRTEVSYDTVSSINRIEANIERMRAVFTTPLQWESTITWTYQTPMTHDIANRWERSVEDLYELVQRAYESFRYCGTFTVGQEGALP